MVKFYEWIVENSGKLVLIFLVAVVFAAFGHCAEPPAPTSACAVDIKKMQKEEKNLQKLKCQLEKAKVLAEIEAAKRGAIASTTTPEIGVAPATQAVTTVTHRQEFDEKGHVVAMEGSAEWKKLESLRIKKDADVKKAQAYSLNPCAAGWLARPAYCFYGYGGGYVSPYGSYGGRW